MSFSASTLGPLGYVGCAELPNAAGPKSEQEKLGRFIVGLSNERSEGELLEWALHRLSEASFHAAALDDQDLEPLWELLRQKWRA